MTDREKAQTIRMWVNEAIHQGNMTVLVMAIKSILDLENDIEVQKGVVKLSEKSMDILKAKKGDKKKMNTEEPLKTRKEQVEEVLSFLLKDKFEIGLLLSEYIHDKEKCIAELEEKISILLSCKNCPDNKGGLLCQKEYEDKCLAQKIQYIKELQEENTELNDKLNNLSSVAEVRLTNWQKLDKGNAELEAQIEKMKHDVMRNVK